MLQKSRLYMQMYVNLTIIVSVCMIQHMQSNYNFTLSHVITCVHVWLHRRSCRAPCYVAACTTAMFNFVTHVHVWKLTAIRALMAACLNLLDSEGIHRNYIRTLYLLILKYNWCASSMLLSSGNIVTAAQPCHGRDLGMRLLLLLILLAD